MISFPLLKVHLVDSWLVSQETFDCGGLVLLCQRMLRLLLDGRRGQPVRSIFDHEVSKDDEQWGDWVSLKSTSFATGALEPCLVPERVGPGFGGIGLQACEGTEEGDVFDHVRLLQQFLQSAFGEADDQNIFLDALIAPPLGCHLAAAHFPRIQFDEEVLAVLGQHAVRHGFADRHVPLKLALGEQKPKFGNPYVMLQSAEIRLPAAVDDFRSSCSPSLQHANCLNAFLFAQGN